ncbi:MAG: hypothetical protein A2Y03_04900 [Omnitrophica WOR_2 bacterium GWF2_38_59]|nr:MAG: hypothetical protein A2Y03_04900 [Omnitrophica WOR_2 bacterium GWF2_38_59]OGX48278.1 MAG: hypothetical protein A2243_10390 [Omnitrophica WOR_2 bacterium RIFOXYA2_FULL_38_17]OGX54865.1 MAG: hypothetical protein A2267_01230 [Omnitrophica WOR_2 bacterium RIFOXYA12_FULL_38_10]OGX59558.1 MAG: hypothetical protein A2447_11910 [Omnitrophica WOR_2 bacterium RIFOXYC2_FULL_38_12]OGX59949.1 MAG: hypothetical protein A2306_04445 [Omnitrophica WOR_2 bacterium RIFOXYB2_FULL_38_16]
MKRRIAYVYTGLNELGGPNNHLKKLYHAMDKERYEVFLVFCSAIKYELESIMLSSGIKEEHLFVIQNIHKKRIFPLIWKLKKYFQEKNIDIVHTFHIQSDIFGGIAAKLAGIKKVYAFFESKIIQESMSVVKIVFYKILNVFIRNIFRKTIVVSNEIKKELINMNFRNKGSIEVVHVGIDVPKDHLERKYELSGLYIKVPRIGTIARFSKEKALDRIVSIVPRIINEYPKARFVFIGDGPERKYLENLVKVLKVEAYVEFKGWVDNIYEELEDIDIFLLSSQREGCPNALLEAMLLKRAVVASNIEGVNEVIDHRVNGLLVNTGDADFFAKEVLFLCSNPEKAAQYGEEAYKRVLENFTIEKEVKALEIIYSE